MRARRGGLLAVAVAASVGAAATDLLSAEIRRMVGEDGEIVAVNIRPAPDSGRPSPARQTPRARAAPAQPPPDIGRLLEETSSRYGFDPALIRAVVLAESAFDPGAVSTKGARGLMQLMPSTARRFGVQDVHDPTANLDAGVAYLRELAVRHPGRMDLALAAYNAGPEAVSRFGGIPPYEETIRYISRIRGYYGGDLNGGDWGSRRGEIRLKDVSAGGVPHFTNTKRRRIIRPSASPEALRRRSGPGGDQR